MKKRLKTILIMIICLGFIAPVKGGSPDALAEGIKQILIFGALETFVLGSGSWTMIHNIAYVNNRYNREPSITTGYIAGGLNIATGAFLILDRGEHIYFTHAKAARDFGIGQIVFGVLCTGSAVWANIESRKPLPDPPPPSAEEINLTPESWYAYWGLGFGNSVFSSEIQHEINQFNREEDPRHIAINLDMFGFYFPVTSKTVTGVVVNGQSDTYRNDMGKFAVRQYLYSASVIHYTGESFGNGLFLRADAGISRIQQEDENGAEKNDSGLGLLGGGGWSFDFDGSRLLLNVNYAYRQAAGQGYHTLGISAGGLF